MPGNALRALHILTQFSHELCGRSYVILILQVKKPGTESLRHLPKQVVAEPGGRKVPEPACSLVQLPVTLPLSTDVSLHLLTQNPLKGLGTRILIPVSTS